MTNKTVDEMTTTELQSALTKARKREEQIGIEAWKNIPFEYEWRIQWHGEHLFYCSRRGSEATRKAIKEFRENYPNISIPYLFSQVDRCEGMEYVLIDRYLVQVSGGTLVLKATDSHDSFSHEPRLITAEEAAMLKAGVVPETLKA